MISVSPVAEANSFASRAASDVSQALAQDPKAARFRKLLLYACTGLWESDAAQLEAVQFCDLLHTLRSQAPTWREVQNCLVETAHRLNKSAEYTLIAHTLLGLLQPLYPEAMLAPEIDPRIYQSIAQGLASDPDLLRFKKLLILACTNQWEFDREKLEQTSLLSLLQTLHSLAPSKTVLCSLLENLVKTLSKVAEYRLLADRLIEACQILYPDAETASAEVITTAEAAQDICEETAAINGRSPATKFSTIAEATAALSALLNEQNKRSNGSMGAIETQPISLASSDLKPTRLQPEERFRLRQAIVQASNPLRTKILLFSLLHEPFQLQQHEAILKDHDLDDLLQMTLQAYRQVTHLKTALSRVIQQLPYSPDYLQSSNTVLQAIEQFVLDSFAIPGHQTKELAEVIHPIPRSTYG